LEIDIFSQKQKVRKDIYLFYVKKGVFMEKIIPEFLIQKIKQQYSEEETKLIFEGLLAEKKTTFRVNRIRSSWQEVAKTLEENHIEFSKADFWEDAFILEKADEERIRELELYKNGKIYLQNLSAMLPVLVLNPQARENILDMCAAPRGENFSNC